jgi:predicted RNase H-like HicB family nuclease
MRYRIAVHKSDEGCSVSVPGLPGCWSQGATDAEAVQNIKDAISEYAKHFTKLVHEGRYVAEVDVELLYAEEGWSPYLSLDDAHKLDDVRDALRRGDVKSASRLAKVYTLTPVSP